MSATPDRRGSLPILLLSLGVGVAVGLSVGWLLPVQRFTASFDRLHPDYKDDYVVMVGNAYLLDGDWPAALARLSALEEDDLPAYVGALAERHIAQSGSLSDIRGLVALSAQLGYTSPAMSPYLPEPVSGG